MDIMGAGSFSQFTYTHTNDDNVKVAVDNSLRLDATVLQGDTGGAVSIGGYGKTRPSGIVGSRVENVYVHRNLQNRNPANGNSCGSYDQRGGLINTRSCGGFPVGLTDFTLNGVFVPELLGANSVGQVRKQKNFVLFVLYLYPSIYV